MEVNGVNILSLAKQLAQVKNTENDTMLSQITKTNLSVVLFGLDTVPIIPH